jgi:ABC-type molybdate transport system substrate-binding protein
MKKKLILVIAAVAALSAASIAFVGQQPKAARVKADTVKAVSSKGASKAPSVAQFTKDKTDKNPTAVSKGGAKATYMVVKNASPYYVYVWMDDEYIGSVSPYGSSSAWQASGVHKLYAESAGGTVYWGPKYYDFMPGATFTWTLN